MLLIVVFILNIIAALGVAATGTVVIELIDLYIAIFILIFIFILNG